MATRSGNILKRRVLARGVDLKCEVDALRIKGKSHDR